MAGAGTILVWLGFAVGLGVIAWLSVAAVNGGLAAGRLPTAALVTSLAGAALVLGSLAAPWIQGRSAETGGDLVLSGWSGLDPLTLVVLVAIVAVVVLVAVAGRRGRRPADRQPGDDRAEVDGRGRPGTAAPLAALAASAAGLVVGNLLIQADQPGGSRVAPLGFALGLAGVALLVLAAALSRRPGGQRPRSTGP